MANKGGLGHLKRLAAPDYWPIHRKEAPWAPKPNPGAHRSSMCIPLELIIRDSLAFAKTKREASKVLANGKVKVDGRARIERNHPTGLMDVIEFTDANLAYRVLPVHGKGLAIVRIPKEEAKFKLCKILRKTTARGGKVQYGTHDGRSIAPTSGEGESSADYSTNDTLRISIPTQRVLTHIKFEKGNYAVVTAGRNLGKSGKIVEVQSGTATRPATVTIEDNSGNKFDTMLDYTFVVGTTESTIKLEAS